MKAVTIFCNTTKALDVVESVANIVGGAAILFTLGAIVYSLYAILCGQFYS